MKLSSFYNIYKDDLLIDIKVQTKASQNLIEGVSNNRVIIKVTTMPTENQANESIIEILSNFLVVPRSRLKIKIGHKYKLKTIALSNYNLTHIKLLDSLLFKSN